MQSVFFGGFSLRMTASGGAVPAFIHATKAFLLTDGFCFDIMKTEYENQEEGKRFMRKKIFVVSDIHGHCTELKNALEKAGFISGDETHLLIACGDYFDRGSESRLVLEYLNGIPNKILMKGNHEDMLALLLSVGHMGSGAFSNGMDCTIRDFFGDDAIGGLDPRYEEAYFLNLKGKENVLSELYSFMDNMYDYFETEHYIFTHGWLPTVKTEDGFCYIKNDFRHEQSGLWERARFAEWYRRYSQGAMLKGKTIVCGHRTSRFGCLFDDTRDITDYSPFYAEGLIAIDTSTSESKQVNVLVIEDEEISFETHKMSLKTTPFLQIRDGEKRVELRLFDEKRKKLRVGDRIVFTHTENTSETICARVIGLHAYQNFNDMLFDFSCRSMGIPEGTDDLDQFMLSYYSKAEIQTYGPLAIRFMIEQE